MRDGWWRAYGMVVVPIVGMAVVAALVAAQRHAKMQQAASPPPAQAAQSKARAESGHASFVAPEPEVTQPSRPTPADIEAMLAPSFDEPRLLEVSELDEGPRRDDRHDVIIWKLRYDGIELDSDVRSNDLNRPDWLTRWHPIRRSPPRWRRADALSDTAAREHAHVAADGTVRRLFHANYVLEWLGSAHTAENEVMAVGSFTATIEVMGRDGYGALIDAYSGAVISKRSDWIQ